MQRVVAALAAGLLVAGLVVSLTRHESRARALSADRVAAPAAPAAVAPRPTRTTTVPATTTPPTSLPVVAVPRPTGPVALTGCPPPPRPPGPPPHPWHPAVLVPDQALPPVASPAPWTTSVDALVGTGMWVWQYQATEGGDADAVVRRAVAAGLSQLWVRVGDSRDGFYAADRLAALVPRAHAFGLRVIGWGFPYLYDPEADARWTAQALAWHSADGDQLDGFSPDIETASEGVALSDRRAAVYLQEVRQVAGDRTLVATVYRPSDRLWSGGWYPYQTIARYVDAFAPMVYWGCVEPGQATAETLARLGALRPVHVIGQAYDMGPDGGRVGAPSAAETWRFLDVARRGGALGASLWVWQHAPPQAWAALAAFSWPGPARSGPRAPVG